MKLRLYALAGLLGLAGSLLSAPANLPKTGLAGSTHDIGGNGCKSCHAPHNGSVANGGPQSTGLILLWARSFPAAPRLRTPARIRPSPETSWSTADPTYHSCGDPVTDFPESPGIIAVADDILNIIASSK